MSTPTQDPQTLHPQPPFPKQQQDPPGREDQLTPRADHGEQSYRGSGKLTGKRVLITGGDSGIGKAVAIAFAREGADIAINYLPQEQDDADDTARWVREAGRTCALLPGDLGQQAFCRQLIDRAVQELGGLDLLVNNAAYQMVHDELGDIPAEEWELTFRINLHAMFYLTQAALPHLQPGSGVINTGSIQTFKARADLLAYTCTKAAIGNFTKALAELLAERGIRVNAVAPGPIWTPLVAMSLKPDNIEQFGGETPLGRPGQPAEVAPAYVLLASDEASYISGAIVPVTGGKMMV